MPIQPTSYSQYISIPKPNTQPIYPRVPLDWRCKLSTEVCSPNVLATPAIAPVFLGQASESGCMVEAVNIVSLIRNPIVSVGSGGTGSAGPAGQFGLGDGTEPVMVLFYTKRFGDETFWHEGGWSLLHSTPGNLFRMAYPILPSPQTGYRLAPYEEMYVALTKAVAAPGLMVFARGGQYS